MKVKVGSSKFQAELSGNFISQPRCVAGTVSHIAQTDNTLRDAYQNTRAFRDILETSISRPHCYLEHIKQLCRRLSPDSRILQWSRLCEAI